MKANVLPAVYLLKYLPGTVKLNNINCFMLHPCLQTNTNINKIKFSYLNINSQV